MNSNRAGNGALSVMNEKLQQEWPCFLCGVSSGGDGNCHLHGSTYSVFNNGTFLHFDTSTHPIRVRLGYGRNRRNVSALPVGAF